VLLVFRLRSLALEREMLRVQAEAAATEHLARTLLRLCDYSNTPLQTIALTTGLLRARDPELAPLLDRLARAVQKLTAFSQVLGRYREAHAWSPGEESLEAAAEAEQLFVIGVGRPGDHLPGRRT
jgi:hypothetical protein